MEWGHFKLLHLCIAEWYSAPRLINPEYNARQFKMHPIEFRIQGQDNMLNRRGRLLIRACWGGAARGKTRAFLVSFCVFEEA